MKPIFDLPRITTIAMAVALSTLLTACGQKGPLYLPTPLPPAKILPKAPNTVPNSSDTPSTPATK